MAREHLKTVRQSRAVVVLAVGCSAELVDACRCVAPTFGAVVKECELRSAPTMTGELRPSVLAMSEDVYQFDPQEIDGLARAVGARIVRFGAEVPSLDALELLLGSALGR